MKEINEKIIILIAAFLLLISVAFSFIFPKENAIEAKDAYPIKSYNPIDIPEAYLGAIEWPEATEQAKGEMFDLFTPPEIFINENGEFVFLPPYAEKPKGPFGIRLVGVNLDPYCFQLEGFVEEDPNDQSKTTIIVHSLNDGKSLRLSPNSNASKYGFEILDWKVERRFSDDNNTEMVAELKILDNLTDEIINLRHHNSFFTNQIEVLLQDENTNETYVLSGEKSPLATTENNSEGSQYLFSGKNASFFIEDIQFKIDVVDYINKNIVVTKIIPDQEPFTQTLNLSEASQSKSKFESHSKDPNNIEEAFNSFFN